jgi:hypothetical protein
VRRSLSNLAGGQSPSNPFALRPLDLSRDSILVFLFLSFRAYIGLQEVRTITCT